MDNNIVKRILRFIVSFGITALIIFLVYSFFSESKEAKGLCEDTGGTVITQETPGFFFDSSQETCTAISCGSITEEQCWAIQKKFRGTDTPYEHFVWDAETNVCMMGGEC
ncbi:MAG: hypothetical protein F4X82_00450 [Candidatus Spechtbacteria bacterium SB0662_bin_43]|uniref:Uncharacterized protein n=1 Tax=Candidatus Spechtbacteria bacterium SB0662_bin_43 TaxID=2604897 RepID=A0A845DAB2_9BACT|nr:hypothetical protein [Candidatus Spechtbacteria bacterium SB0662_bin_43]